MQIVDSHLHFWNPGKIDYFWLNEGAGTLNRHVGLEELEAERQAAGVTCGVFVQASHDPREMDWVLTELNRFPWVSGVVAWLDLQTPDVEMQARQALNDVRFKGVRHLTHDIPDAAWLGREDVGAGLEVLEGLGLSLDLVLRPEQLALAVEVVGRHPGLTIILDHLGNPPLASGDLRGWTADLKALAALPNVCAKVSGLLTRLAPGQDHALLQEAVRTAFDTFGAHRLMYGGDWPVATRAAGYRETLDTLRSVLPAMTPDEEQAFWAGTAGRVYRLSQRAAQSSATQSAATQSQAGQLEVHA